MGSAASDAVDQIKRRRLPRPIGLVVLHLLVWAVCWTPTPTAAFSVAPLVVPTRPGPSASMILEPSLQNFRLPNTRLWAAPTEDALPDIDSMRATQMKKELESYGISTKTLLEKSEFAEALRKARDEGKTPISKDNEKSDENQEGATSKESSASEESGNSREERYQEAMEEAKSMKVKELKKALQDRGISTTSFFEKSEFVKAYADAVADNKAKTASSSSGKEQARSEEPRDPSYRDVVTQKFDRRRLQGQAVIDISLR